MAHEYSQEPYKRETHIPKGYDWPSLRSKNGAPLEAHYLAVLQGLGKEPGMLGAIVFKAQNKIQDPAKLSRLVQLIDAENWMNNRQLDLVERYVVIRMSGIMSGGEFALFEARMSWIKPIGQEIVRQSLAGGEAVHVPSQGKAGRNDPCRYGSGRKFKRSRDS